MHHFRYNSFFYQVIGFEILQIVSLKKVDVSCLKLRLGYKCLKQSKLMSKLDVFFLTLQAMKYPSWYHNKDMQTGEKISVHIYGSYDIGISASILTFLTGCISLLGKICRLNSTS